MGRSRPSSSLAIALGASIAALVSLFAFPRDAHALGEPTSIMGGRGQLAIDQISGFRMSTDGGLSYYGPLGFSTRSYSATNLDGVGQTVAHYTTFWIAPSADYFVLDNFSVGGLIELSTTSTSIDYPRAGGATQSVSQPTTTSFTLLPRAGYLFELSNRFAIWPRGGIGYVSRQLVAPSIDPAQASKDAYSSFIMDLDVGFLFRFTDSFFIKAGPDLAFALGGSHSVTVGNVTRSADASVFQFSIVSGVGGFFDLM